MMLVKTVFVLSALAFSQVPAEIIPVEYPSGFYVAESANSRIVSGWDARPGQHPHQVSLRMVSPLGAVTGCGGSIVHREWIVSAAHCTAAQVTVVVRAGLVHLTRPEIITETTEFYNYPTFNVNTPLVVQPNDISLVKLPKPLVYSNNVRPIRIQSSVDAFRNYDESIVYASGFGRTWTGGSTSESLQWVYLRGVSNPSCQSLFGTLITANTVCARFYNVTSQSICQGDSGGPLVNVEADGTPTLIGVSSFVAGGDFGCHSGLPGGFIRPGPFHSWFQQITNIDFNNLEEEDETTEEPSTTSSPPIPTTNEPTTPEPTTIEPTTPELTTVEPTTNEPTTVVTVEPDEDGDSEEIDDPEIAELLKRLEVKVKVKVKLSKYLKKKRN